jgi:beta-lactamase superfamily II metal-dependent hydrolase
MSIVKSLSVGDGDMFYIKHGSDNFTIIDCCMSEGEREEIVAELKRKSANKSIIRFISTHPDDDHILGLEYLDDKMKLLNFYCVWNEATKKDSTDDFDRYCSLRDSDKAFYLVAGCRRKWLNQSDEGERGGSGINILWPETANEYYKAALKAAKNGKDPNNISPIIKYSLQDGATILWMGDMETDFMENIKDDFRLPAVDILFAPHHGRDSGKVPQSLLDQMSPKIIVIGEALATHLNYYDGYNTITQNSAGDIIFECTDKMIHIYISNYSYEVDFLEDYSCDDTYGYYLGTLKR